MNWFTLGVLAILSIACGYVIAVVQTWVEEERQAAQEAAAIPMVNEAASSSSPPGAFKNLPPPLLGAILRLVVQDGSADIAARLNLVCRAFSATLPHAFSSDADLQDLSSAGGPSAAFVDELRDTWPYAVPPSSSSVSPSLTLDLDRLGSAAFVQQLAPAAAEECVRRTGQRFAQAHTLCVVAHTPSCVRGAALFVKHAAPRLRSVRRLVITGQLSSSHEPTWCKRLATVAVGLLCMVMYLVRCVLRAKHSSTRPESSLPPLWEKPAFAHVARGVRELSVSGPAATLAALAAQLPDHFPSVTALRLTLYTATEDFLCPDLTVKSPPGLRILLLSVKAPLTTLGWGLGDPDNLRDLCPLTLTLSGRTGRLQQLYVHTCPWLTGPHRHWCRPLVIAGRMPALWYLDATVSRRGHKRGMFPSLCLTCPELSHLVLRALAYWQDEDGYAWGRVMEALAPLAGRLQEVELLLGQGVFGPFLLSPPVHVYQRIVFEVVRQAMRASLPTTRLSVYVHG